MSTSSDEGAGEGIRDVDKDSTETKDEKSSSDEDLELVGKVASSRRGREPSFTNEEDIAIARSFISVSTDSICAADQGGDEFWGKVADEFNLRMSKIDPLRQRTLHSIKSRCKVIQTEVFRYNSYFTQVKRTQGSGVNDEGTMIARALELYDAIEAQEQEGYVKEMDQYNSTTDKRRRRKPTRPLRPKDFQFLHVWKVVRDNVMFLCPPVSSRFSNEESPSSDCRLGRNSGPASSSSNETREVAEKRPAYLGNKKAKRIKLEKTEASHFIKSVIKNLELVTKKVTENRNKEAEAFTEILSKYLAAQKEEREKTRQQQEKFFMMNLWKGLLDSGHLTMDQFLEKIQ